MKELLITLTIGILAAAIDTIPMYLKKLDGAFILSASLFWILVAFALPRITLSSNSWLNGIILAMATVIPLLPLIYRMDRQALVQVCITTVVLGALVGAVSGHFMG